MQTGDDAAPATASSSCVGLDRNTTAAAADNVLDLNPLPQPQPSSSDVIPEVVDSSSNYCQVVTENGDVFLVRSNVPRAMLGLSDMLDERSNLDMLDARSNFDMLNGRSNSDYELLPAGSQIIAAGAVSPDTDGCVGVAAVRSSHKVIQISPS